MRKFITIIALLIIAVCLFGMGLVGGVYLGSSGKLSINEELVSTISSMTSRNKMTSNKYNQIMNNMSYKEVISIVGKEGTLVVYEEPTPTPKPQTTGDNSIGSMFSNGESIGEYSMQSYYNEYLIKYYTTYCWESDEGFTAYVSFNRNENGEKMVCHKWKMKD